MPGNKRLLKVALPVAFIILAPACAGIHVSTDYNHRTDFSNYHTYSWLKVSAPNSLWADRIRRDVNSELASKGWTEVPSGGQAAVSAFAATREQPTLQTFYDTFGPGFGGWHWWGPGFYGPGFNEGIATTQVVYTPIGSLTVDIFNGQSKHLIWRGTSSQALSGKPARNRQKLEQAVVAMFKKFPPPSRG